MRVRLLVPVAAATAAIMGLSACSSSTAPRSATGIAPSGTAATSPATTSAAARSVITIKDFAYRGPSTVPPGTTVSVHNEDAVAHTVTADHGNAFDVTVPAGGTATFTAPDRPGRYGYHCTFHANMHGTLTVG